MHRWFGTLLVCCVAACGGGTRKSTPPASAPASLWHLAPADTAAAGVFNSGALPLIARGERRLIADLARRPKGADTVALVRRTLGKTMPPWLVDSASWEGAGLDMERGAAFFLSTAGRLTVVLPVRDRDAFVRAAGGRTTTRDGTATDEVFLVRQLLCRGHATFHVCVEDEAMFQQVGASREWAGRIDQRRAELRGPIEIFVSRGLLATPAVLSPVVASLGDLDAAIQLAQGEVTAHVHWHGTVAPDAGLAELPSILSRTAMAQNPSGVLRVRFPFAKLFGGVPDAMGLPPPLHTLRLRHDVIDNLTGESVIHILAGDSGYSRWHVGLRDPSRIAPLFRLESCKELAVLAQRKLLPQSRDGLCVLEMPGDGFYRRGRSATLAMSTDSQSLMMRIDESAIAPDAAAPTALGKDIGTGDWALGVWAHGLITKPPSTTVTMLDNMRNLAATDPLVAGMVESMGDVIWLGLQVTEVGLAAGFRPDGIHAQLHLATIWSDNDEHVSALQAVASEHVAAGNAGAAEEVEDSPAVARVRALAAAAPDSPLGRAHVRGSAGIGIVWGNVGISAAFALPTLLRYIENDAD